MHLATPPTDTQELVFMLKQRTRESFAELYDKYSPALYGIICKIINDATAAEDVLQEAFVKIWKNIDNYSEGKGSLFTWVLSIARHTAIDYLRSKQHKYRTQIQNTEINEYIEKHTPASADNGSSGYRNIIAKLEPKYRQVLDMVYFFGYTQEEVSKILDLPLGTVKTRARTGLQILRKLL